MSHSRVSATLMTVASTTDSDSKSVVVPNPSHRVSLGHSSKGKHMSHHTTANVQLKDDSSSLLTNSTTEFPVLLLVSPPPNKQKYQETKLSMDMDALDIIHPNLLPTAISHDDDWPISTAAAVSPHSGEQQAAMTAKQQEHGELPSTWWEAHSTTHSLLESSASRSLMVTPPRYYLAPHPPALLPTTHSAVATNKVPDPLSPPALLHADCPPKTVDSNTVLIYELVNDPDVVFQIRPSHSLHHLCKLVCDEWMQNFRRHDCAVEGHLWQFRDNTTGETYERTPMDHFSSSFRPLQSIASSAVVGSQLELTYDYDAPTTATLQLRQIVYDNAQLAACCPGRYQDPTASWTMAHLLPHQPPPTLPTLDEKYQYFSKRVFGDKECPWQPVNLFLFQPGLKNHHAHISTSAGYIVWVPERMDTVEHLFSAIEQAFAMPTSSSLSSLPRGTTTTATCTTTNPPPQYCCWEDRIMYPRFFSSPASSVRFHRLRARGERVLFAAPPEYHDHGYFAKAFPKCHRAYMAPKARDRGWIHYANGVLKVCRGRSRGRVGKKEKKPRTSKSGGDKDNSHKHSKLLPECFRAGHCFEPMEEKDSSSSSVVGKVQHTFTSLQDLFCAAESLWD